MTKRPFPGSSIRQNSSTTGEAPQGRQIGQAAIQAQGHGSVLAALTIALVLLSVPLRALETTEWKTRQPVTLDHAGLVRLALPPATFDAARDHLEDLRLLDPAGHEMPYLLDYAAPVIPPATQPPRRFRSSLTDSATEVLIETGTTAPIAAVDLSTPHPSFLKAARVETSSDGEHWQLLLRGSPLFRQFGAEQLRLELDGRPASYLRITVDDTRSRPIPFTGATLALGSTSEPPPALPLATARLARREEFAGETVLVVDLGARNVPVTTIEIEATDSLFTRNVTIGAREVRDETAVEQTLATGTIFRLAIGGVESSARLAVATSFQVPTRELVVHIANRDSPPLAIQGIKVAQRQVWMVFSAPAPGRYVLLTGNRNALAPHYDLSAFAGALRSTIVSSATIGAIEPNPEYQEHDALAHTPLLGGALDPSGWRYRRAVQVSSDGVQQLELDVDVLAGTENNLADVRLVRDGLQIPYLLERPSNSRRLPLAIVAAPDPRRPRVSRWQVKLPRAGLPISQIRFTSSTALFQRTLRLSESVPEARTGSNDRILSDAEWHQKPGEDNALAITLGVTPVTDTLWIETDNGDNPPITLATADATYRVARLLFRTNAAPLTLIYGNAQASVPHYDIALIADQLVSAEKNIATLGPEQKPASRHGGSAGGSAQAGIVFWTALGLVVVALLIVVAKLLPKPPG